MTSQLTNISSNQNFVILDELPNVIRCNVLSFCNRSGLVLLMRVCKLWKSYAEESSFWEREFSLLGLKANSTFSILSKKVRDLQKSAELGDALLKTKVKTAFEFDMAMHKILKGEKKAKTLNRQEEGSDNSDTEIQGTPDIQTDHLESENATIQQNELDEELNNKLGLHDQIEKGLYANLFLYKIGLKPLTALNSYAQVLKESYGSNRGWEALVNQYIQDKQIERALQILDEQLRDEGITHYIDHIVSQYCQENKFNDAIQLVKKYANAKHFRANESSNMILAFAYESDDLLSVEVAIDTIVPEDEKFSKICDLIEAYIKKNQMEKAQKLADKYHSHLQKATEDEIDSHLVISIFVKLNFVQKAWDAALKRQDKDDIILCVLRNAFADCYMIDQAKKVENMLPKKDS